MMIYPIVSFDLERLGALNGTYEEDHCEQENSGHEDREEEQPSCIPSSRDVS